MKKMTSVLKTSWWLLLIAAAIILFGCARARPTPTPTLAPPAPTATTAPTSTPVPTSTPAPAAAPAPRTMSFTLSEFSITPQDVSVALNETVTWSISNAGTFPHNLFVHGMPSINERIGAELAPGQSKSVTLSFDKTGYFPIYCSVGPHEGRGMVGSLQVTGPVAGPPAIKQRYPAATQDVMGPNVVVAVEITGFEIDPGAIGGANQPGKGHWHLLLDGRLVAPQGKIYTTLPNVAPGQHTVKAELHNNDHSPLSPAVEDSVTFNVIAPPAPTPAATPAPAAGY